LGRAPARGFSGGGEYFGVLGKQGGIMMEKVHYFFDESGEKGFLKADFLKTDIGLIAGIALPSRCIAQFDAEIGMILSKLDLSSADKVHATELFNVGGNIAIRDEVFGYLSTKTEWLLVYEAIYPYGLFKKHSKIKDIIDSNKPINPRVKVSKDQSKMRIYNILLQSVIIQLDQICRIENSTELIMLSDMIDTGIYKEALKTLAYLKERIHTKQIIGFDTIDKKKVSRKIVSEVKNFDATVRHIKTIIVENEPSNMTFAADIIANTLYRHLKDNVVKMNFPKLHGPAILEGFILKDRAACVGENYFTDNFYSPHEIDSQ